MNCSPQYTYTGLVTHICLLTLLPCPSHQRIGSKLPGLTAPREPGTIKYPQKSDFAFEIKCGFVCFYFCHVVRRLRWKHYDLNTIKVVHTVVTEQPAAARSCAWSITCFTGGYSWLRSKKRFLILTHLGRAVTVYSWYFCEKLSGWRHEAPERRFSCGGKKTARVRNNDCGLSFGIASVTKGHRGERRFDASSTMWEQFDDSSYMRWKVRRRGVLLRTESAWTHRRRWCSVSSWKPSPLKCSFLFINGG